MTPGSGADRGVEVKIPRERANAALQRGLVTALGGFVVVLALAGAAGTPPLSALPTAIFAGVAVGITFGLLRYSTAGE